MQPTDEKTAPTERRTSGRIQADHQENDESTNTPSWAGYSAPSRRQEWTTTTWTSTKLKVM